MSFTLPNGKKVVVEGSLTQTFWTAVSYFADRTKHEANDVVTSGKREVRPWVPSKVMHTVKGYGFLPNSGFGNQAWLLHEATSIVSRLCHLDKDPVVSTGDMLDAEDIVGLTGQTGYRFPITTIHNHNEEYEADGFDWAYLYRYGRPNPANKRIDPLYSRNQSYQPPAPIPVDTNKPKQRPMYQIFQRKRAVSYFDGKKTRIAVIDTSKKRQQELGPLEVYFLVKPRQEDNVRNFFMHHPDGIKQIKFKKGDGDVYYLLGLTRYDVYVKDFRFKNKGKLPEDRDNGAKSKKSKKRFWYHDAFLRKHPGALKQVEQ